MTTIVSWTLCGSGRAEEAMAALESVANLVDRHMVVDTSPVGTPPLYVASTGFATSVVLRWPWLDDFAAARNSALGFAADMGAEWGLMLDSDERVICPDPQELRLFLAWLPADVDIALAHHDDGSHTRERFFRLPHRNQFVGRTHETIVGNKVIIPREIIRWTELPKSPKQLRAKFLRDVDFLRAGLIDDPANGAAHYYLGETLQALGQHDEAINEFRAHNRLSQWEEGRAWACFKAAESYHALKQPYRVLECAAQGLVHDAGMAELYWIAATACWAQAAETVAQGVDVRKAWEWVEQARCWGEVARVHGAGSDAERRRVGKRDIRGLDSGVTEVLEAVRKLGGPS